MSVAITRMIQPYEPFTCALCTRESNVYKCFSCGRHACANDYSKRNALCRDCAEQKGIEIHRNSIFYPIFR